MVVVKNIYVLTLALVGYLHMIYLGTLMESELTYILQKQTTRQRQKLTHLHCGISTAHFSLKMTGVKHIVGETLFSIISSRMTLRKNSLQHTVTNGFLLQTILY